MRSSPILYCNPPAFKFSSITLFLWLTAQYVDDDSTRCRCSQQQIRADRGQIMLCHRTFVPFFIALSQVGDVAPIQRPSATIPWDTYSSSFGSPVSSRSLWRRDAESQRRYPRRNPPRLDATPPRSPNLRLHPQDHPKG